MFCLVHHSWPCFANKHYTWLNGWKCSHIDDIIWMHHNVGIIFSHQTVLSLHAGLRQLNKDMILQYDRQKFLKVKNSTGMAPKFIKWSVQIRNCHPRKRSGNTYMVDQSLYDFLHNCLPLYQLSFWVYLGLNFFQIPANQLTPSHAWSFILCKEL